MRAGRAAAPAEGEGADGGDAGDFRCLVRATDGKRKFSTAVRGSARAAAWPAARDSCASCCVRRLLGLTTCAVRPLLPQLAAKQVARFHASYSIIQKARARCCVRRRLCCGTLVCTRDRSADVTCLSCAFVCACLNALSRAQAHMDALKVRQKEKAKPAKAGGKTTRAAAAS
jgi:hypothetical protein